MRNYYTQLVAHVVVTTLVVVGLLLPIMSLADAAEPTQSVLESKGFEITVRLDP